MIKRHAFTLTETLIMVAVIGIIAVISAISLKNMQPDKDAIMVRKAYTETSKAVAALINDQELYPYAEVSSLQNNDGTFLASVFRRTAAFNDLNQPSQTTKVSDVPFWTSCTIIGRPSSSFQSKMNPCTPYGDGRCLSQSLSSGILCMSDCSWGCDEGYHSEDGNTCVPDDEPDNSDDEGELIKPDWQTSGNPTNADDISTKTGNKGTSSFKDGTYDDTNYSGTSTTSTVKLNPHGTVFLNTTVMNGATGYTSANKFAYNFGGLFKTNNRVCNGSVCTFTTDDGMDWEVTDGFQAGNVNTYALVKVDINGAGTKPNSEDGSNPDIYTFRVDPSGAITVEGDTEAAKKARAVLKDRSKR